MKERLLPKMEANQYKTHEVSLITKKEEQAMMMEIYSCLEIQTLLHTQSIDPFQESNREYSE